MKTTIFDLDMTVIDSSHRKVSKPCGSIDLDHWFANCTFEKIFQDRLMPLALEMRNLYSHSQVVVCTARTMGVYDFMFLRYAGLHYDHILYRPQGDMTPDGELKAKQLSQFMRDYNVSPQDCLMWDDNLTVHDAVVPLGIKCLHPDQYPTYKGY